VFAIAEYELFAMGDTSVEARDCCELFSKCCGVLGEVVNNNEGFAISDRDSSSGSDSAS
jgi:hypothetical protein